MCSQGNVEICQKFRKIFLKIAHKNFKLFPKNPQGTLISPSKKYSNKYFLTDMVWIKGKL